MKKPYFVTDLVGTHINGERIRDQDVLDGKKPVMLTESQAEHLLRIGQIKPAGASKVGDQAKAPKKKG